MPQDPSAPVPLAPFRTRLLFSDALVLVLTVVYFLVLASFTPGLASPRNLLNILSNVPPLLVVAVGQTFVLIAGGIDLSITATIALASVVGASIMTSDGGLLAGGGMAAPAGVAAMLGVGLGIGLLNGAAVTGFGMPAFIVTLSVMTLCGGIAVRFTKSESLYNLPGAFNAIGQQPWLGAAVAVLVALAAHVALSRSLFGRRLYAIGQNAKASRISGVPVRLTATLAYVASGLSAAVASILITGRLETASPEHGKWMFLDVIGAAVIGGTSLSGGKGSVPGAVYGVVFITVIDNSLTFRGASDFVIPMVKGGVILLAAFLDVLRTRLLAGGRA